MFGYQRPRIPGWGNGAMGRWLDDYGLDLDRIALANLALCPDGENAYRMPMLRRCFRDWTARVLELLAPRAVLLAGAPLRRFTSAIEQRLPGVPVFETPHYKKRGSREAQRQEGVRIQALLRGG